MLKRDLIGSQAEEFLKAQARGEDLFTNLMDGAHLAAAMSRLQVEADALLLDLHRTGHREAAECLGFVILALSDAQEALKEGK